MARHPVTHPFRRELSIMPEENMPLTSRIIHLPLASRSGHPTPICAFSCPRVGSSLPPIPREADRPCHHQGRPEGGSLRSGNRLAVACGFTPRSLRGISAGAEPEVRIHLPPARHDGIGAACRAFSRLRLSGARPHSTIPPGPERRKLRQNWCVRTKRISVLEKFLQV